jgi:glycosyltransferase involved in cell wall biosynthesis
MTNTGSRKILFASVHPPGRVPSQRFRFEQYVDFLAAHGFATTFSPVIRDDEYSIVYGEGRVAKKVGIGLRGLASRVKDILHASDYDIVVVQRESIQLGTAVFERVLSSAGPRLVFDFDDAIWLPNASSANSRLAWLKRPQKTETIIAASDLVLAGNRYLRDYAYRFNDRVEIIPTTIDTSAYGNVNRKADRESICLGWSGSLTTIQHFQLVVPVLRRIRDRYGARVRFKVIGDPAFREDSLDITGVRWSAATEITELSDIDIGLMPLPDDEWAKGKCGLKGLQYMAMGIPAVMSRVGVNSEIIEDGRNGFLATSEREWYERLSQLVDDRALRVRLGAAARATVVERYSVESQKHRYLECLTEVLNTG